MTTDIKQAPKLNVMRNPALIFFILLILAANFANGQQVTVSGKVSDKSTTLPLTEVNVVSGNRGTQTDSLGRFSIVTNVGRNIEFSAIGFQSFIFKVTESDLNPEIVLQPDAGKRDLNEVVVVGFSKKSRLESPAATATITADDIKDVPASSVMELMQGKVAGVNIQNNSGQPGARGSVFQRGLSNLEVSGEGNNAFLAPTQPLIIIDNVPIDVNTDYEYGFAQAGPGVNPLALLPPEDIESVQILKDAAATSVYGSRGAYGVWIINTKKGRSGKPQVNYTGTFFVSTVPKLREVYGGIVERQLKIDQTINYNEFLSPYYGNLLVNSNYMLSDSLNPYINNSTNWQSYFYKRRFNQTHNLAFSGGDNQFNYKINLGYYNEKGIIENTGFSRYSLGMNTTYETLNKKFRVQAAVNASNAITKKGSGVGLLQYGVATSGMASTLLPPPDIYTENNEALAAFRIKDDNSKNTLLASVDVMLQLLKNVRFSTQGSVNWNSTTYNTFYPGWVNTGSDYGLSTSSSAMGQYNSYARNANDYYNRNMLQFNKSFNDERHNVSSYLFTDLAVSQSKTTSSLLYGTPNDYITGPFGYIISRSRFGDYSPPTDARIFGYGGNVSYNYLKKYIMEFNYRIDGTSTNGPLSGYRHNPSLAVRWNFFKEKFMQQFTDKWLDYASLRGSWGKSISPQGDVFSVYGIYEPGTTYMGTPSIFMNFSTSPNAFFLPNTSTTWNGGFEASFFKGRFSIEYDTYYRTVENLSRRITINKETGYTAMNANEVSMVNYGHELSFRFVPIQRDLFKWTMNLNGAYNTNILTHLPHDARQLIVNPNDQLSLPVLYRLGRSSLGNYLFNTKGVYSTDADVPVDPFTGQRQKIGNNYLIGGDPQFADLNGDFVINDLDRVAVGDPQPKLTGGLINTFNFLKNWSLMVSCSYTFFRDVLNTPLAYKYQMFYSPTSSLSLPPISEYNYWQQPGDVATYPNPYNYAHNRAGSGIDAFRYNQTLFMEDGSYFKFNYATLTYNLDREFVNRLKFKSARVYVTAKNLLILTNYSGPNPENVSDLGRDNPYGYPNSRQYSIGINATF